MSGTYNQTLAILAILIAIAASYTALDVAARIRASTAWGAYLAWLGIAAVCMGGGIWSMHFVAMLAYSIPGLDITYDPWLTALSLLTAVSVTGIGFWVVSHPASGRVSMVLSGLFMGAGILAMHYIGMAAMKMDMTLDYDPLWVAISVVIAIGAAIAALWFAFRRNGPFEKGIAACIMGVAISGMHFAGMRAADFSMQHMSGMAHGGSALEQGNLAMAVITITFLILFFSITIAMFDRRLAALVEHEATMLKKREEQFRLLYRRTPLPLHALDELGRIEEVSDAWLSLLGYAREEVVGRPLINFMVEESARRRVGKDWPTLLREGENHELEYRLVTRQGQFLDVLSTSRVERDAQGNFLRVVGGLIDLTARKQAEDALRQSQKMEAVGQLTGGIAHDFNNILAIVMGSLELLRKRLPPDERLVRLADNALEGARRGANLTQRMLAFARRQTLNPQPVDLLQLVLGMKDMLERTLGPKIRIGIAIPADLPAVVADPHQLETALLNLAVNARDAMTGEGAITIEAGVSGELPQTISGSGDYICLSVTDTGEGMDAQTLARAQEPFFTTKGVGKGTGLGLSMVSGFAEQSGGALTIVSERGQGTTVRIWLPAADAAAPAAGSDSDAPLQEMASLLKGEHVLLVDDDLLVLLSTQTMLEELGAGVTATASAMEALTLLKASDTITCVVTDYAMPGMSGAQLAAAIRVVRPALPIVIATGYVEVPEEIASYPMIQKPFTAEDLGALLGKILPRREPRDTTAAS